MKKTLSLIGILTLGLCVSLNTTQQSIAAPKPNPAMKINWMGFDKAQAHMKVNPKNVYINLYSDACHWCKVMDKKTLSNPKVITYLNENFYCIRFNAASKQDIVYKDKVYSYDKEHRLHGLAIELMKGKLKFPISVFLEKNFNKGQPVTGFLEVADIEMILRYMAEGKNKTMPWSKYQKEFKSSWH